MRLAVLMFVLTGLASIFVVVVGRPYWDFLVTPYVPGSYRGMQPAASAPQSRPPVPQDAPARLDSCSGKNLRVVKQDLQSDVGNLYGRLVVTNAGQQLCTIQGYPEVRRLRASQVVLRSQAVSISEDKSGPLIFLRPSQSASAAYSFTVADPPSCPRYDRTQVLLPHDTAPLLLSDIDSKVRPGLWICRSRVQYFTEGVRATWQGS